MEPKNQPHSISVIGAGIVGVCYALSLEERGDRVTLSESGVVRKYSIKY